MMNFPMMHYGYGVGLEGFGLMGWISMVFWWLLLIAGVVFFVKWIIKQGKDGDMKVKSALDILKERYAKGEIDKKEFEEKKKDLM